MKKHWAKVKAFAVKTIGRLSTGISLSLKHGMTSGVMLEYIYDNRARGSFFAGKIIDRMFLNCKDLQALRARKDNVKTYISRAIDSFNRPVRIVDIAAGYARYLREALPLAGSRVDEVVLIDTDYTQQCGVESYFAHLKANVRYEGKSAFNDSFLKSLAPADVVVAAGLYDWVIDDALVRKSIASAYGLLSPGGQFILTTQSKNSDLDLMREAFTDFDHKPLLMKTRPLSQITEWLKGEGFFVEHNISDKYGHYHTVKAVKPRCL